MAQFRILVVDDEPDGRSNIKGLLKHYFPEMLVAGEAGSAEEAIELIKRENFELLFLDVELKDGTGFDVLDQFSSWKFNIIFTTAHDEFAIRAFRYQAMDYLLKPIDPDEFVQAVNKTIDQIGLVSFQKQLTQLIVSSKNKSFDRITLATSSGHVFADTKDITRIETYGNYTFVYLAEGERLLVSRNLKEFEEMLPEPNFFRIHQSHIVNTSFVKKFIKSEADHVIMIDGSQLPVSRRRKDEFTSIIMGRKS